MREGKKGTEKMCSDEEKRSKRCAGALVVTVFGPCHLESEMKDVGFILKGSLP